jgi:hypothetical protein
MYSPKIREDLIPVLYKIAKEQEIPMTELVDRIIREEVSKYEHYLLQLHEGDAGRLEPSYAGSG